MLVAASAITFVAGCTTNPYTHEQQVSKAATGAAVGAAAGAAIGALSGGNRGKRALIGAGAGAVTGAGVGYYMDVQEAKLRQQLEGTGVSVSRIGDQIVLNMPGQITFATNRSEINPGFFDVLNSVALVLKEYDKTLVQVAGHTDSTGSEDYNRQLSEQRAASVSQFLMVQGLPSSRIQTAGRGEAYPIASNDTPEGRQRNRRVELTLFPTS
jgi:outer membrane protein OmpA-like peptidoglycan-associated protein